MLRKFLMITGAAVLLSSLAACGSATGKKEESQPPSATPPAVEDNAQDQDQQIDKASDVVTQVEAKIMFQLEKPEFMQLLGLMKPGPIVPGLALDMVPQGLDHIKEKDWFVVSHYRKGGGASVLSFIDAKTGEMEKYFHLSKKTGDAYAGHAGGVAVSEKHAWVSSDQHLYQAKLEDIYALESGSKLQFTDHIKTDTRASFNAYADGVLWVGEFAHGLDYPVNKDHKLTNRDGLDYNAWIMGYKLNDEDTIAEEKRTAGDAIPDYILSVDDRMQGIELLDDQIILSQSFGRNNSSEIIFHENVLLEKPHTHVTIEGTEVPVWFLDSKSLIRKLEGPPMSESAIVVDQSLYIMFESASDPYRDSGSYPLDRIQYVELNNLPEEK